MSGQKAKVLELLKSVSPLPNQGRNNITSDKKGLNKGVVLGKVYSWTKTKDGRQGIITGRQTEKPKYKELFQEASKLMKQHNPNFKFSSVQINENQKTSKHKDGNNVGQSYIIGLGDYTGGDVRLYSPDGKTFKDINIKNRWIKFNGSELEHETTAFKGTRYTLVFYNIVK